MLTIIGFLLIGILMYVLIRGKMTPITAFIVLPVTAAVCAGFGAEEIGDFIVSGMESMLDTEFLFTFSLTYFSIMSDI